jgi:hypothetical protein
LLDGEDWNLKGSRYEVERLRGLDDDLGRQTHGSIEIAMVVDVLRRVGDVIVEDGLGIVTVVALDTYGNVGLVLGKTKTDFVNVRIATEGNLD